MSYSVSGYDCVELYTPMGKCPNECAKISLPSNSVKYLKAGRTFATQLNGSRSSSITVDGSNSVSGNLNILASCLVFQARLKQEAMIEIDVIANGHARQRLFLTSNYSGDIGVTPLHIMISLKKVPVGQWTEILLSLDAILGTADVRISSIRIAGNIDVRRFWSTKRSLSDMSTSLPGVKLSDLEMTKALQWPKTLAFANGVYFERILIPEENELYHKISETDDKKPVESKKKAKPIAKKNVTRKDIEDIITEAAKIEAEAQINHDKLERNDSMMDSGNRPNGFDQKNPSTLEMTDVIELPTANVLVTEDEDHIDVTESNSNDMDYSDILIQENEIVQAPETIDNKSSNPTKKVDLIELEKKVFYRFGSKPQKSKVTLAHVQDQTVDPHDQQYLTELKSSKNDDITGHEPNVLEYIRSLHQKSKLHFETETKDDIEVVDQELDQLKDQIQLVENQIALRDVKNASPIVNEVEQDTEEDIVIDEPFHVESPALVSGHTKEENIPPLKEEDHDVVPLEDYLKQQIEQNRSQETNNYQPQESQETNNYQPQESQETNHLQPEESQKTYHLQPEESQETNHLQPQDSPNILETPLITDEGILDATEGKKDDLNIASKPSKFVTPKGTSKIPVLSKINVDAKTEQVPRKILRFHDTVVVVSGTKKLQKPLKSVHNPGKPSIPKKIVKSRYMPSSNEETTRVDRFTLSSIKEESFDDGGFQGRFTLAASEEAQSFMQKLDDIKNTVKTDSSFTRDTFAKSPDSFDLSESESLDSPVTSFQRDGVKIDDNTCPENDNEQEDQEENVENAEDHEKSEFGPIVMDINPDMKATSIKESHFMIQSNRSLDFGKSLGLDLEVSKESGSKLVLENFRDVSGQHASSCSDVKDIPIQNSNFIAENAQGDEFISVSESDQKEFNHKNSSLSEILINEHYDACQHDHEYDKDYEQFNNVSNETIELYPSFQEHDDEDKTENFKSGHSNMEDTESVNETIDPCLNMDEVVEQEPELNLVEKYPYFENSDDKDETEEDTVPIVLYPIFEENKEREEGIVIPEKEDIQEENGEKISENEGDQTEETTIPSVILENDQILEEDAEEANSPGNPISVTEPINPHPIYEEVEKDEADKMQIEQYPVFEEEEANKKPLIIERDESDFYSNEKDDKEDHGAGLGQPPIFAKEQESKPSENEQEDKQVLDVLCRFEEACIKSIDTEPEDNKKPDSSDDESFQNEANIPSRLSSAVTNNSNILDDCPVHPEPIAPPFSSGTSSCNISLTVIPVPSNLPSDSESSNKIDFENEPDETTSSNGSECQSPELGGRLNEDCDMESPEICKDELEMDDSRDDLEKDDSKDDLEKDDSIYEDSKYNDSKDEIEKDDIDYEIPEIPVVIPEIPDIPVVIPDIPVIQISVSNDSWQNEKLSEIPKNQVCLPEDCEMLILDVATGNYYDPIRMSWNVQVSP